MHRHCPNLWKYSGVYTVTYNQMCEQSMHMMYTVHFDDVFWMLIMMYPMMLLSYDPWWTLWWDTIWWWCIHDITDAFLYDDACLILTTRWWRDIIDNILCTFMMFWQCIHDANYMMMWMHDFLRGLLYLTNNDEQYWWQSGWAVVDKQYWTSSVMTWLMSRWPTAVMSRWSVDMMTSVDEQIDQ